MYLCAAHCCTVSLGTLLHVLLQVTRQLAQVYCSWRDPRHALQTGLLTAVFRTACLTHSDLSLTATFLFHSCLWIVVWFTVLEHNTFLACWQCAMDLDKVWFYSRSVEEEDPDQIACKVCCKAEGFLDPTRQNLFTGMDKLCSESPRTNLFLVKWSC